MTTRSYTVLGWLVWQIGSRIAKRKRSRRTAASSAPPASSRSF